MKRRLAVNTRLLLPGKLEGIGWFTYETLKRITAAHPEVDFHFFFDRPFDERFVFQSNVTPHVVPPQARHPILFYLWFEHQLPHKFQRIQPDLFLSPDGYASLRGSVPQLPVIHDINFEHFPQFVPLGARRYLRHYFPRFARKAERIATVSEFSKADIAQQYGIDPGKIDVVYNGASDRFRPLSPEEKKQARQRYAQGSPYWIYVGALQPRKNLPMLLKAFDQYKTTFGSDHKLVLTGARKWWGKEENALLDSLAHRDEVLFTGRLEQEVLADALGGAEGLTYVSLFEGFGIPLIEAMKCGVPVITSDVTSLPEIAGNAALLVDPNDPKDIAQALHRLGSEDDLRETLIQNGLQRNAQFSWDRTADLLWQSIEKSWKH